MRGTCNHECVRRRERCIDGRGSSALTDFTILPQLLANGIVIGSIFALAGIGLSLVYGILNLANFAHGDFVTLGAFLAFLFAVLLSGDLEAWGVATGAALLVFPLVDLFLLRLLLWGERLLLISFGAALLAVALVLKFAGHGGTGTTELVLAEATLLSIVFSAGVFLAFERVVWRTLRKKKTTILSLVIVSIGVSLVVRNLIQIGFGTGNRSFDRPTAVSPSVFGVQISDAQQFTLVAAILLILGTHLFLTQTRTGKAMRAMADNLELARVSGIDVDREVAHVWVLTAILTATSGVLYALVANNVMNVNMGVTLILPLFAAVILGGIGSPYGAMAGGFILGVAMKTATLWIGSKYEVAAAFIVLIAMLLVRPQGLFGVKAG